MGDDNEIRQVVRRQSEQFLDQARNATKELGQVYNLDEEFKKSRKNKSYMVYIVTAVTIAVLGGAAFFTTSLIRKQTAAMPVDVNAFQDLNLRDVLDRAKRDEADLEAAKLELSRLESDQQTALASAERDKAASIDTIKASGLSDTDERAAIKEAEAKAAANARDIKAKFTASIAQKKKEVTTKQEKVDSYNQRMSEQTRKQQEKLDSQTRLFDLEKERLVATYDGKIKDMQDAIAREEVAMKRQREELQTSLTTRWNPTYADAESAALLTGFKLGKGGVVGSLPDSLASTGILSAADAAAVEASRANYLFFSAKLRAVPYLNSVPPALARMEYEARLQFDVYRAALIKAGGVIDARDKRIAELEAQLAVDEAYLEQYRWSVSQFVLNSKEGGYIVDCRNPAELFVSLNPAVPVAEGGTGYIVRQGDKAIATLSFYYKAEGGLRAKLVQIAAGEKLKPFDPITVVVAAGDSGSSH
jgi:hypothetical protein